MRGRAPPKIVPNTRAGLSESGAHRWRALVVTFFPRFCFTPMPSLPSCPRTEVGGREALSNAQSTAEAKRGPRGAGATRTMATPRMRQMPLVRPGQSARHRDTTASLVRRSRDDARDARMRRSRLREAERQLTDFSRWVPGALSRSRAAADVMPCVLAIWRSSSPI